MYDVVNSIISHFWTTNDSAQQYIYFICGALIIVGFAFFLDCIRSIVLAFRRKR